jgi:hypothetical protein
MGISPSQIHFFFFFFFISPGGVLFFCSVLLLVFVHSCMCLGVVWTVFSADPLLVCDEKKLKVIRTDARKFFLAPEMQLNLTRTTIKARTCL